MRRLDKLLDKAMADEIEQPLPAALQPAQDAGVRRLVRPAARDVHPGDRQLKGAGPRHRDEKLDRRPHRVWRQIVTNPERAPELIA